MLSLSPAQTLVFDQVRLVDVDAATVSEPQRLAIRDGFIVDAEAGEDSDEVITTPGYLIPGLAEMPGNRV